MIQIPRLIDQNFPGQFTGQALVDLELKLLNKRREFRKGNIQKAKDQFDSDQWKKAKDQLILESKGKCAYCETPFTVVAYGDVEHYRPKSKYWWLAYSYNNYLASCQLCNQKFKSDKFPKQGKKLKAPIVRKNSTDSHLNKLAGTLSIDLPDDQNNNQVLLNKFIQLHQTERPHIFHPSLENPEPFFAYEIDDIKREVVVTSTNVPDSDKYIKAAEKVFGINRKELKELRYLVSISYRVHRQTVEEQNVSPIIRDLNQALIDIMKTPKFAYSGMIRYLDNQPFGSLPDMTLELLEKYKNLFG